MKRRTDQRTDTVAYILSKFPVVTETFVLNEMLWLEKHGLRVEVFPLLRMKKQVLHAGARHFLGRLHHRGLFTWAVFAAQCFWLIQRPRVYAACWRDALWGNCLSPGFFARALMIVPKAAWFARTMRELNVRHIHAHFATHAGLAAYCAHRLTRIPYSITIHSGDIFVNRTMLEEKIRRSCGIVTISDFNRRFLIEKYGRPVEEKIQVIRCGVHRPERMGSAPRPRRRPVITCIASFDYYKGHRYLVEACAELKRRGLEFVCVCVGAGPDLETVRRRVRALGLREMRLVGAKPHHHVMRLLSRSSLMVLPSLVMDSGKTEGIPVALMEALAHGIPVVSSDISGIPELVESGRIGGLLVPQKNADALADAMERLLRDPARAECLGARGRERVLAQYNLDRNMEQKKQFFLERLRAEIMPAPTKS